jgi:FixJ family two-component response regulator
MTKRKIVSVVDDDDSVRESLPDLLRSFGFDARPFACPEDFLASDLVETTDCLVLDVAMPGMSGPDLQGEIIRRGLSTGIVFITAHADPRIAARVIERGAVALLLKPFSEQAIIEAVDAALGNT